MTVKRFPEPLPADADQRVSFLAGEFVMHADWPRHSTENVQGWRKKYATFSRVLVEKAAACGLDSVSLERVLKAIVAQAHDQGFVCLPVAAYLTTLNGEPVWIIGHRWGIGSSNSQKRGLWHVDVIAVNKDLQRIGYAACD